MLSACTNCCTNCCFSVIEFQMSQVYGQELGKFLLSYWCELSTLSNSLFYKMQVFRTALSNRLAKVQGFLFRAAFLRRAPLFLRLITENIMLCFMLSTMHSTSKYITGALSLRFRKILTKLIHSHYFEVATAVSSTISLYFFLLDITLVFLYYCFRIWYTIKYHMWMVGLRIPSNGLPAMYQDSPLS